MNVFAGCFAGSFATGTWLRSSSALLLGALLATACRHANDESVFISPTMPPRDLEALPAEPFGSPSPAYTQLREVTDSALARAYDGELGSFAGWLEEETVSVERALVLLKALRAGASDEYAVANGRVALVYEHIARALSEASAQADAAGYEAEWMDKQSLIRERANGFWARCSRLCGVGGAHLDAWDLRCRRGLSEGQRPGPRQPK